MIGKTAQRGVTILEILLVLAIASSLIVMAFRMYQTFNVDKEVEQAKYNVNVLFQALANYYRANCIKYQKLSGGLIVITKNGMLDPGPPSPTSPYPIKDIQTELKSTGLLSQWPFSFNRFINNTGPGNGYVIQFNRVSATRSVTMNKETAATRSVGEIYLWTAQVAVQVSDATQAKNYQNLLGGDCLSSYDAGTQTVAPCSSNSTGDYIVWERLPSFASPETMSDLWPTMPTLNQFTQMYTTAPILKITDDTVKDQYYYCGG